MNSGRLAVKEEVTSSNNIFREKKNQNDEVLSWNCMLNQNLNPKRAVISKIEAEGHQVLYFLRSNQPPFTGASIERDPIFKKSQKRESRIYIKVGKTFEGIISIQLGH